MKTETYDDAIKVMEDIRDVKYLKLVEEPNTPAFNEKEMTALNQISICIAHLAYKRNKNRFTI